MTKRRYWQPLKPANEELTWSQENGMHTVHISGGEVQTMGARSFRWRWVQLPGGMIFPYIIEAR